ncbi:hemolysin family protein [Spiroplasma sp. AdecLV25b]|uniref:hemolysin family protein n=1 Tax=Spiroplasma sp. AdecLV25b TaxID=3027162 RepID=UPI0027E1092B|nr:hemolysin family protein [Spiroplasma sp. AdecLV25b]
MESNWYIYIIILVILLFLSSFYSSAETSLTSLNVIRIKSIGKLRSKKNHRANIVFKLVKNYNTTLTTILIGNTLINVAIGTLSTVLFIDSLNLPIYGPLISTLVSATVVLIIGEIIPKSVAKLHPEAVALNYAYILYILNIIFYPFTFIFKLFQIKSKKPTSSEQELIELISIIEREGVIEKAERDLIESAIKFDEKSVFQAMHPKSKSKYIYDDTPAKTIKQLYLEEKYSRIPVIDRNTDNVIGILNIKEFIINMLENEHPDLLKLMLPPIFISKRAKLNEALELLQSERMHLAIVCNNKEKKDFSGIITLEDILEELVGEIYDETDEIGLIQEVGTHKFRVDGSSKLEVLFKRYLKKKSPNSNNQTVQEWYMMKTKEKKVRKCSPVFKFRNFSFKVVKVKKEYAVFEVEVFTNKKIKNEWE